MARLSIIIPCYNEADNIPFIIDSIGKILDRERDVEVVLVNNGSTDNSSEIIEQELGKEHSALFKVVTLDINKGYGFGILEGLKAAKGDALSWTHADMQTDPYDAIRALKIYEKSKNKNIIVKGKRKNRECVEAFFTWCMQLFVLCALRQKLDDINAQPKLFPREFYENFIKNNSPFDFSLDLYALYQAKIHCDRIISMPVDFKTRLHGEAKGGGGGGWKTRIKLIGRTYRYILFLKSKLI